jgi:YfiH family protein
VFAFREDLATVGLAFTDRRGGTSDGPFASLNLSDATGDDPQAVARNLQRLRGAVSEVAGASPPLVLMHQVHGADVHVVDEAGLAGAQPPPVADALVTTLPGVALVVRVADCVPVLLADEAAGVVAVAHAGRPGLVAGVVPRTVAVMRELGAADPRAWTGPHVCGACYEVPEQLRDDVCAVVPQARATTSWGTASLDIGAGVVAQLAASGVPVTQVSGCTREDERLFSYRRQGRSSGRMAGLVWRRS